MKLAVILGAMLVAACTPQASEPIPTKTNRAIFGFSTSVRGHIKRPKPPSNRCSQSLIQSRSQGWIAQRCSPARSRFAAFVS
jgi:hypothetical protein